MASDTKIGDSARNKACDGVVDRLDAGAGAGVVKWFTGAPPANCAAADTGTLLATFTLAKPAFGNGGASVVGDATAVAIASVAAVANGTLGHFRGYDSTLVCHIQGTAGEAADTPDLVVDDKTIVATGTCTMVGWTVSVPEQ